MLSPTMQDRICSFQMQSCNRERKVKSKRSFGSPRPIESLLPFGQVERAFLVNRLRTVGWLMSGGIGEKLSRSIKGCEYVFKGARSVGL